MWSRQSHDTSTWGTRRRRQSIEWSIGGLHTDAPHIPAGNHPKTLVPRLYRLLQPQQIRLIQFLDDTGLQCNLESYDLDSAPPYIALSYTWGRATYQKRRPPDQSYHVRINGESIEAQQNLHDGLRHLAKHVRRHACKFWVNYICIDQENLSERSVQVQMMKEIYEKAKVIYFWLGRAFDDEESGKSVALMRELNQFLYEGLKEHNGDIMAVTATMNENSVGFPRNSDPESITAWQGIAEIFNQPYWQRTWIYQEATTPGQLWFWCGRHSFNDIHLSATVYFAREYSRFAAFRELFASTSLGTGSTWSLSLSRTTREICSETDARDKIFASRGQVKDIAPGDFVVDYTRSLAEVYTDVVRFAMSPQFDNFVILGYVQNAAPEAMHKDLREEYDPKLPSWVPDWRKRVEITPFKHTPGIHDNTMLYNASAGRTPIVKLSGERLKIEGFILDTIDLVLEIWDDDENQFGIPQEWERCLSAASPAISIDAIRKALVADIYGKPFDKQGDRRLPDHQWMRGGHLEWTLVLVLASELDVSTRQQQDSMTRLLQAACFGRRMGAGHHVGVGIFPAATRKNDHVTIFNGGYVPYVVRDMPGTQNEYTFIGECYVDGIMDGQALELAQEHRITQSVITLVTYRRKITSELYKLNGNFTSETVRTLFVTRKLQGI